MTIHSAILADVNDLYLRDLLTRRDAERLSAPLAPDRALPKPVVVLLIVAVLLAAAAFGADTAFAGWSTSPG